MSLTPAQKGHYELLTMQRLWMIADQSTSYRIAPQFDSGGVRVAAQSL
jgi:hypothetical protein